MPVAPATLAVMDGGRAEVGQRIRDCAQHRGIDGPSALRELFLAELVRKGSHQEVTRQTLSNWWHGKVYPDLDTLWALAAVLGTDQEWILFGSRRGDQLKKERQFLARVSEEELTLLTSYRETSKAGQKTMLRTAKNLADEHPAPEATVHPMRRKDDKR